MNHWIKRIAILVIIILTTLVGSGALTAEEGKSSVPDNNPGELTEFYYLPLIRYFSPVWFLKTLESPIYLQNYANNAGCNWLGIAGLVFDLQGYPVALGEYQVHAWGGGIDERVLVGGAPAYGPSGYEVYLYDSPIVNDYNLQLETAAGHSISPIYEVQTHASCSENLLFFSFLQNN
ncbi:MAG: hypothetical protein WAM60_16820 [Candidatus Promineifilaceae bacterium]